MQISWHEKAWSDYLYWQAQDKKTLKQINKLIRDIQRAGSDSTGQTEFLKGNLSGYASARIDDKNRLIYQIKNENLQILSCRGHYSDK